MYKFAELVVYLHDFLHGWDSTLLARSRLSHEIGKLWFIAIKTRRDEWRCDVGERARRKGNERLLIKFYRFTSMNYVPNYLYLFPFRSPSWPADNDDAIWRCSFFDRDVPRWSRWYLFCFKFKEVISVQNSPMAVHIITNNTQRSSHSLSYFSLFFWHFKEHAIILYQWNKISPRLIHSLHSHRLL